MVSNVAKNVARIQEWIDNSVDDTEYRVKCSFYIAELKKYNGKYTNEFVEGVINYYSFNKDSLRKKFLEDTKGKTAQEISVISEKLEIRTVPKELLNIDYSYQRKWSEKNIEKFSHNWNELIAGTLTVAEREDKTLWVVDGQHRLMAAMRCDDVKTLNCIVFQSKGQMHEAGLFALLNTHRRNPSSAQRFRANIISGDSDTLFIRNTVTKYGFKLSSNSNPSQNIKPSIICYGVMYDMLGYYGRDVFEESIKLLSYITPNGTLVDSYVMRGIAYIIKYGKYNHDKFVTALSKCDYRGLMLAGKSELNYSARKSVHMFARGMVSVINTKLRGQNKITFDEDNPRLSPK